MRTLALLLLIALAAVGGWLAAPHLPTVTELLAARTDRLPAAARGERKILFYRNPMNPAITSPTFTKDEMGMDYIPVYEGEEGDSGAVTIAPEVAQNLGLRSARVERGELTRRVETVGYVDYDERLISHVHLRTEGWIERLTVRSLGERVEKGQLLFELYSPLLVYAQQEYLQAVESGGKRLARSAVDKLAALGAPPGLAESLERGGAVQQRVKVYARQAGTLTELNVREGMFVKPEASVMAIADLSSVWVQAEVFEAQAAWMLPGLKAQVRLPRPGGVAREGVVEYVYPALDPVTRALKVRLRFDNPDERFKPNMYTEVTIHAEPRLGLSIPREALIRDGGGARVIVERNGAFEAAAVTAGAESGDRVEILEGLDEGEVVVTSAQFLIDSEASLKASIARMTRPERAEPRRTAEATGRVEKVSGATINLTHDPIPALGWPTMTMDFTLAEGVAAPPPGSMVRFTVAEMGDYLYVINAIEVDAGAPAFAEAESGHHHAEGPAATGSTLPEPARSDPAHADRVRADGVGLLHKIDAESRVVNLTHEPIAAVGWPAMTMEFQVEPGVVLEGYVAGDRVRFTMEEREDYQYVLVALEPAP